MSTPPMNEGQLRDVLARVVPEAPDSVADPAPVVRAARVRRRAQVALVGGAVAVIAVAAVVGGRAFTNDDSGPQIADDVPISGDPYSAAACPEVLPESGPLPDLSDVKAVRFCAAGFNGFPAQPGPPDALVDGIDWFAAAVTALPAADPARCAAVDVIPSDSRLAFELADGTLAFVPATMCTDVTVVGQKVDGAEVTTAFVAALDAQREEFPYMAEDAGEIDCEDSVSFGPAQPGRESLVTVGWCAGQLDGGLFGPQSLALVDEAWERATVLDNASGGDLEPCLGEDEPFAMARTDRGDLIRLPLFNCERLAYESWEPGVVYQLDVDVDELTED